MQISSATQLCSCWLGQHFTNSKSHAATRLTVKETASLIMDACKHSLTLCFFLLLEVDTMDLCCSFMKFLSKILPLSSLRRALLHWREFERSLMCYCKVCLRWIEHIQCRGVPLCWGSTPLLELQHQQGIRTEKWRTETGVPCYLLTKQILVLYPLRVEEA